MLLDSLPSIRTVTQKGSVITGKDLHGGEKGQTRLETVLPACRLRGHEAGAGGLGNGKDEIVCFKPLSCGQCVTAPQKTNAVSL